MKQYYDIYLRKPGEGNCRQCQKPTSFDGFRTGYSVFCSSGCRVRSPESREGRRQTNLKKYGVEHPSQAKQVKKRARKTLLERYGVDNNFKRPEVKEKIEKYNLVRYGDIVRFKSKIFQQELKENNLQKYGVENVFQRPEIQQKYANTVLKKYGVFRPMQNKEVVEKMQATCRERYWETFLKKLELKGIIPLFNREYYKKPTTSKFEYKCLRCDKVFTTDIRDGYGAVDVQLVQCSCSRCRSVYEDELLQYLTKLNILQMTLNSRFSNGQISRGLDFYLPKLNLGIEFNGIYWHSELFRPSKYHQEKYLLFQELGIELIQIFENEWTNSKEIVKSIIRNRLGLVRKLNSSKCFIREVSNRETIEFLRVNSLQKFKNSQHNYGLYYNEQLIRLLVVNKRKTNKNLKYEIVIDCTKLNYSVIEGLKKFLVHFRKDHFEDVFSCIDVRYSQGKEYLESGFVFAGFTKPNCFYIKPNCMQMEEEQKFPKYKLSTLFKQFNSKLTAAENMLKNNYLRIYDAGSLKVVNGGETV